MAPGIDEFERRAVGRWSSGQWRRARLPEPVVSVLLRENLLAVDPDSIGVLGDPGIVGRQMRIACVDPDRLGCRLGNLFGSLGVVAMNGRAKAKPRHHGVNGGSGLVPRPWLRLRLAGKCVRPGRLAQRLGKACLRFLVQALLSRQQAERGDQGDRQSNLPTRRLAQEVEEELYRPPFRHQIPLLIRRGEVESRRWQRHHASVTTQRLARSTSNIVGPPSRAASRPGRPT